MKTDEPTIMQELHQIREQLYEEMKSMPGKEQIEYTQNEARAALKKYGLNLKVVEKTKT